LVTGNGERRARKAPGVARDRLPDHETEVRLSTHTHTHAATRSKNTSTTYDTTPGQLALYALTPLRFLPRSSRFSLVGWLVGRGVMAAVNRKRVSGPTVYHRTHSHSCERSIRVRRTQRWTRRDELRTRVAETRSDTTPRERKLYSLRLTRASTSTNRGTRINATPRAPSTLSSNFARSSPFPCPWRSWI